MHVPEVVDRHARDDELDVFFAEAGDGLAEFVVLVGVFAVEEGDLDDGDVEGIGFGVECYPLSALKGSSLWGPSKSHGLVHNGLGTYRT